MSKEIILKNNTFYSQQYAKLMEVVGNNLQMQQNQMMTFPEAIAMGAFYNCDICTWPLIFSQARREEFEQIIKKVPALMQKAVRIYFGTDAESFSEYLQMSGSILQLLHDVTIDSRDYLQRHDVLFSNHQCKLLEINAGSDLGAWEADWLYTHLDTIFAQYPDLKPVKLTYIKVMDALFTALFQSISRLKTSKKVGNILFIVEDFSEDGLSRVKESFLKTKNKFISQYPDAQLLLCHEPENVEFGNDRSVICNGITFDAVIQSHSKCPESVHLNLISSFLAGKAHYPDNPLQTLIGNKILMALLYEDKVMAELTSAEVGFIKAYIPWSKRFIEQTVSWEGQAFQLSDLLKQQQHRFVLKKGESMRGEDVIIGQAVSQEVWVKEVEQLINAGGWLVQEYCPPDTISNCDANGFCELEPVWGIYDFGHAYSGGIVRAARVKDRPGVINSARGASLYLVAEAEKQKLSI